MNQTMKNLINEYENEMDMESNRKFGQVPFQIGIPNDDQLTDYMNACIMGLCSTKKFVGLFGSRQLKRLVKYADGLLFDLSNLVTTLYCNDTRKVDMLKVKFRASFLGHPENADGLFSRNKSGDTQTFFVHLIHWLKNDLNKLIDQTNIQSPDIPNFIKDATSCLNEFYVNMKRISRCCNSHFSYRAHTGIIIDLDVIGIGSVDIKTLIGNYFKEKQAEEYPCSFCKTSVRASHRFTLTVLPQTMLIFVKPFEIIDGNVCIFFTFFFK
jgi:uncharacterized UBP type Zn finger protein